MKVLKLARHFIDLCFHVYDSPSIKDDKRGNEQTERHFTFGARKKFPDDINEVHDLYVTHLKGNRCSIPRFTCRHDRSRQYSNTCK